MASSNPFLFETQSDAPADGSPVYKPNPFIDTGNCAQSEAANNPFSDYQNVVQLTPRKMEAINNPFADMGQSCFVPSGESEIVHDKPSGLHTNSALPDFDSSTQPITNVGTQKMEPISGTTQVPVSDETLHLLVSVTGHLEATCNSLVGQLEQVKTPRHTPPHQSKSPSPTMEEDPAHDAAFSAVFAQTVEEISDHEHDENHQHKNNAAGKQQPPMERELQETSSISDVQVDLWDTATTSKAKTKDQILSLFNQPSNPIPGVDLLSSSIHEATNDDLIPADGLESTQQSTDLMNQDKAKQELDTQNNSPPTECTNDGVNSIAPSILFNKPSSPSQEVPLKPLYISPVVFINDQGKEKCAPDTEGHTATAFMDSYVPSDQQTVITPPTPISPIKPSPMPSVVCTPVVEEQITIGLVDFGADKTNIEPSDKSINAPSSDMFGEPSSMITSGNTSTSISPSLGEHQPQHKAPPRPAPPPRPSVPEANILNIFDTAADTSQPITDCTIQSDSSPTKRQSGSISNHMVHTDQTLGNLTLTSSTDPLATLNPFASSGSVLSGATHSVPSQENRFNDLSSRFDRLIDIPDVGIPNTSAAFSTSDDKESSISAWGGVQEAHTDDVNGFGDNSNFDSFLAMTAPPAPHSTPARGSGSHYDGDTETEMSVVIRPQQETRSQRVPALAPPPKTRVAAFQEYSESTASTVNPFLSGSAELNLKLQITDVQESHTSGSAAETPLYDEDISQPLEPFPRTEWQKAEFNMYLRHPNKKKITGHRFWKKIFVRLGDNAVLQLFNDEKDSDPFQELPLQACYSVSDIGTQQYDQYGKIFTMKLQYIFYKERPGVRPGQITKAEKITKKLGQFAMSAWEGDYDRVKEFASDVRKLGMPVEHAPQISQLVKLGTQTYEDLKLLSSYIEETLFKVTVTRDRALTYKTEEVQVTGVDEVYIELNEAGSVLKQIARVRLFFLAFLSGMPDVELGMNDLRRQGKEVVGRHDIIPVATEEWIRLEDITFHSIIDRQSFDDTKILKFKPPDGCYLELMRYRIRPPKGRELPLQVKVKYTILKQRVEIFSDILVPGYISRKMGQIPCEDVSVRIPLPDCWVYMFRVEKHFRYGSVKAAHRRQGKVKGLERIIGAVDALEQSLMEVSSGTAKYERQHRAIVWRIPRLPKEGQGAYTNHTFSCKMSLTSFDQMPDSIDKQFMVEYTMPHTTVSHTVCRSVSLSGGSGENPEKYVRYLARYEYKQGIEFCYEEKPAMAYSVATIVESSRQEEGGSQQMPSVVSSESDTDSE